MRLRFLSSDDKHLSRRYSRFRVILRPCQYTSPSLNPRLNRASYLLYRQLSYSNIDPASAHPAPIFDDLALTFEGNYLQTRPQIVDRKPVHGMATKSFDPKLLLNPKGALKRERNDGIPPPNSKDDGVVPSEARVRTGMGSMIEKVHNVGKRQDEPRKRMKTSHALNEVEGEDKKKSRSAFHASTGRSVIGDYVKTKREQGLDKAGPASDLVDLTNGAHNPFS